jgi:staphylococcal nuclease domain-containing protein 1
VLKERQNVTRANQYLNGFKRQGRFPAMVEYVASGSRFKCGAVRER